MQFNFSHFSMCVSYNKTIMSEFYENFTDGVSSGKKGRRVHRANGGPKLREIPSVKATRRVASERRIRTLLVVGTLGGVPAARCKRAPPRRVTPLMCSPYPRLSLAHLLFVCATTSLGRRVGARLISKRLFNVADRDVLQLFVRSFVCAATFLPHISRRIICSYMRLNELINRGFISFQ